MMLVAGIVESFVPAYGLTNALWIVFVGVLNYVAYRDIFERRSANFPRTAAAANIVPETQTSPRST
jgi:hypothetical protein